MYIHTKGGWEKKKAEYVMAVVPGKNNNKLGDFQICYERPDSSTYIHTYKMYMARFINFKNSLV